MALKVIELDSTKDEDDVCSLLLRREAVIEVLQASTDLRDNVIHKLTHMDFKTERGHILDAAIFSMGYY